MANLNHFAISASLRAVLGPRIPILHGQIGSAQTVATLSNLLHRRREYIEDLSPQDDLPKKFEKAVTRAYLNVRQGFSSDRVLADPSLNAAFIQVCRALGLDNSIFHLNLALIG